MARGLQQKKPRSRSGHGFRPGDGAALRTWAPTQLPQQAPAYWAGCWPCLVANVRQRPQRAWLLVAYRRRGLGRCSPTRPQWLALPTVSSCGSGLPRGLATGTACSCPPCLPTRPWRTPLPPWRPLPAKGLATWPMPACTHWLRTAPAKKNGKFASWCETSYLCGLAR